MADRGSRELSSWFLERKVIGDRIRLYIGVTAVGRQPGSALCILDSHYVSRRHAEITVDNDEKIVLKDLNSINGTFVNGSKVQNGEITLKANDCIGVGVTDDSEPNLKHPIYKLIYAPLPKATSTFKEPIRIEETQIIDVDGDSTTENSKILPDVKRVESKCSSVTNSVTEASTSSLLPGVMLPPTASSTILDITTNKKDVSISNVGKSNENLKASTPLPKVPTLFSGDVIVLSDDEEDNVIRIKEEKTSFEENSNGNKSIETVDENSSNKPNLVLSIASASNKPPASSSGTTTDNDPSPRPANDNAVIHEPITPDVKREMVHTCFENVVQIFGGPDEVILQSVKAINPLVFKKLNDGKAVNKPLCDGDSIDLLSEDEDNENNIAQNVECFGVIVPADTKETNKTNNTNISVSEIEEVKQADNNKCQRGGKSPNLFDNSLNSSKNSVDEQRSVSVSEQNAEKPPEGAVNNADELAAFVDMDDDVLFSQILLDDIKSEMIADNNEDELAVDDDPAYDAFKDICPDDFTNIKVKKEPIDDDTTNSVSAKGKNKTNDIENDVWITIDDDAEYYDEELENKVSDWSTKLLSQKMNMSQVFDFRNDKADDSDKNHEDSGEEGHYLAFGSEELDDFFNEELVDDVIATLAKKNGEIKTEVKPTKLERRMTYAGESNYDAGGSKELLKQQKKPVVQEKLKKTQLERKSSGEITPEPTVAKASTSNAQRIERAASTDGKEKEQHIKNGVIKPVKRLHHPPSVIDAPCLPIHKGKHRGVSAETRPTTPKAIHKKVQAIKGQLRDERYRDELKRKWLEKPSDERRRECEKKRTIKESRKEKLKELADKHVADSSKELLKRKHTTELEGVEKKKPKVKVTTTNRGAFLAEDISGVKKVNNTYRIPKTKRLCGDATTATAESTPSTTATATATISKPNQPNHTTIADTFAQEMSKVDQIIRRRLSCSGSTKPVSRSYSLDESKNAATVNAEAKALMAPVRNKSNKITFASMQKNFTESRNNQKLLQKISNHRSCLIDVVHRNANVERQKKRVRFNDAPIIHYIERVSGANKRVDCKDILPSPTCADRAQMVRQTYAMIDKTAQIISQILGWSNEWLINRNAQVDAASDILLPMPNQFSTFNHYKSIIIPLMKLEFISMLERDNTRCKAKPFTLSADQVSPHMDRYIILGRGTGLNSADTKCELVVLEWGKFKAFAYMSSKRVGFNNVTLVYEVLAKDVQLEELRANLKNPITVRPMVDIVRVEFGAFNAVYQLEQSPLLKQILDPMELCKIKPYPKCNIQYNGCDPLNNRQKDVLLRTYRHAIEPTPNITLIQGPPGTGKSCVIANLVHQLLYGNEVRILDQKVLVCAQSNAAVDVIAEKLFNMSQTKSPDKMYRLIRFGMLERINPKVRHATLPKIIERNQIRKLKETCKNLQIDSKVDIKEYLRNEILQIESDIAHMKMSNVKDTVQEEVLLEKQRQIQLMRNIVNGVLRPEDENSLYKWHLKHANIVCTTLSSCVKLSKFVNYFDVCIIDEATQCTEPWTLMPLKFGINTLVLVGDTQQLPATVLSKKASDFGLGTSLFTRIQHCIESVTLKTVANVSSADKENNITSVESTDIIFSLQTQYRMHPEICKWPNSYFYKNELIDDPKTHQYKTPLKPFSVLNLCYTQNDNCHRGQIANELEAKFVARLVKTLDGYIPIKYNTYGVITPYAQQRVALEKALRTANYPNVMVNTIDSYQGMERDVIIISNARTTGIGFLANYQRLNVALTRPKKCLILCGNFKNLESVPAWRSLLTSARERKLYHELSANCMDDMHRTVIPKIKMTKAINATTEATPTTTTKEVTTVATTTNQSQT